MPYAFLPDTSVLLNGKILDLIQDGTLLNYQPTEKIQPLEGDQLEIILSRVVLAEIEGNANHTKVCGSYNIEIIEKLYQLSKQKKFALRVVGNRPTWDQIRINSSGELDAAIRRDTQTSNAILVTADNIQATMALIEGLEVFYLHNLPENQLKAGEKKIKSIQDYFDDQTMSLHLRAHCIPLVKRGKPGDWKLEQIGKDLIDPRELGELAGKIISEAKSDEHSFVERSEIGVDVVQFRNYRIVICRPPFSNAIEITAVRPIISLTLEDYHLPPKVFKRLETAEGVLVAGSPGAGKSTFISALVKFYLSKNKIVKTLESVRDLNVPPEVSQYAPLDGNLAKTADILLLVRPDFTVFDEVRVDEDFKTFGDMRLAGVGMVGVVHASRAVDAIQRFIRRVELGVIPNVIDTVLFIDKGEVTEILSLNMTVKKPTGFKDEDLSRPVIEIRDYMNGDLLYEIYNFGQDAVVNRVGKPRGSLKLTNKSQESQKTGKNPREFNDEDEGSDEEDQNRIDVRYYQKPKAIVLTVGHEFANAYLNFYSDDEFVFSGTINNKGEIHIKKSSPIYPKILKILNNGNSFTAAFN